MEMPREEALGDGLYSQEEVCATSMALALVGGGQHSRAKHVRVTKEKGNRQLTKIDLHPPIMSLLMGALPQV